VSKYKGYNILKHNTQYIIQNAFKEAINDFKYASIKECKGVIDNLIEKQNTINNRYMPCHKSKYYWAVIDKATHLYVQKDNRKLLLFNKRQDCFKWCEDNNAKINDKSK